ncbi:MAG: FliA/WhiG family RNA polymerase sigma factor, partial [Rhodothermia bacterium]|nr:FliA/WhiG family RNA polymerase sigma factor [Rhodothermia bacterium]
YIGTLIKDLAEREQAILGLDYYENLTLREIAALLSLTEARISQILGKILKTLRARLAKTQARAA